MSDVHNLQKNMQQAALGEAQANIANEPMFIVLLNSMVSKLWANDSVVVDFVNQVAPLLSERFSQLPVSDIAFGQQRGIAEKQPPAYSILVQPARTYLFTGLFAVLNVARILQDWHIPQFRVYDETIRRVFIASYILRHYLKIPGVAKELESAGSGSADNWKAEQISAVASIVTGWCEELGLDLFLQPVGNVKDFSLDIINLARDPQSRQATKGNISQLKYLSLSSSQLDLLEQLRGLADLLAFDIKTPADAETPALQNGIGRLSMGLAKLTYHHISDNRGVMVNFINNAALSQMSDNYRQPLLYAPSGIIYLEHKKLAPSLPEIPGVAKDVAAQIQKLVRQRLAETQNGMGRDGRGMKYASYYWLFFSLHEFIPIGVNAVFKVIDERKKPSSGRRFEKMKQAGWMPAHIDLNLPDDINVDRLAEWCFLAEAQVKEKLDDFDTYKFLLHEMGLQAIEGDFLAIPRDSRVGGVGYHWYFAAGTYIKKSGPLSCQGLQEKIRVWAHHLCDALPLSVDAHSPEEHADWHDLRDYIQHNLILGDSKSRFDLRESALVEFNRYVGAKRKRSGIKVCSMCSSSQHVDKQAEPAVLFAPVVYSNKKPLNGSDSTRDICSICGIETMLRQILMSRSATNGSDFEDRLVRYMFCYPDHFYTAETLGVIRYVTDRLKRLSLTELRRQLLQGVGKVDFSASVLQKLQEFILMTDDEYNSEPDRYVRLLFPETELVTFFFFGIPPPSRDPRDVDAWIHPAMLSLLLSLCLDVKVVASESPIPLFAAAKDINETVLLTAPHSAIQYITEKTSINADEILPILQRMFSVYFIHMDANASNGADGFNYRWQDITATARDLAASSCYAFYYLKKWQKKLKLDFIPPGKAAEYLQYVTYLGVDPLVGRARVLTKLYRQFYLARQWKSYEISIPITRAARAILDSNHLSTDSSEFLVTAVHDAVRAVILHAYRDGSAYLPKSSTQLTRETALRAFSVYFVNEVYLGVFRGDNSAMRGHRLSLLKSSCEIMYIDEAANDKVEREIAEQELVI